MFGNNKNLKDSKKDSIKDTFSISTLRDTNVSTHRFYTKTDKLISALYMVTDIIEGDELLKNKLRTLGIDIVSDMHSIQQNNIGHIASSVGSKVSQIMSFLEIAFNVNLISEMNYSILRKEFLELDQSLKESIGSADIDRKINLTDFFRDEMPASRLTFMGQQNPIGHQSIGHQYSTRIGVQKGSTLLKALSDRIGRPTSVISRTQDFDILKKQRREDIIKIIKALGGSATIKDIKDKIKTIGQDGPLATCGEKTLQRELVSMVRDGVLNKTGEKRWSRYFLIN